MSGDYDVMKCSVIDTGIVAVTVDLMPLRSWPHVLRWALAARALPVSGRRSGFARGWGTGGGSMIPRWSCGSV